MEKKKCPEVRFKGFGDGWKQQTLGDMFIPLSNNTLSRADLNYDIGQIKNIHYGDILVKYAAVLDYKNDKIPFITDGEISEFKSQLLQNGDVIFADTAEDETVGKAIEINVPADTFIVSGLHTMAYRPKIKLSSFYLGHYLNSNAYHHQLLPLMQGIKVLSISRTNLAKTIVKYPLIEQEQTQIGNFFQNLDQSIALHEKKLAQTQNLKKAMLEKMFPKAGSKQPEIRLKGFSGDWEQYRLGELCSEFCSGEFIKAENIASSGDYPVYGGNGLRGYADIYNHDGDFALIGRQGALCGNMQFSCGKAFFTEHAVAVKANNSNNTSFLYHLLGTMNLGQYSGQSAQPGLAVGNLIEIETLVPCKTEQIQIGQFFKQLDQTITLQQQQLQSLKKLKQAFLEKMFV